MGVFARLLGRSKATEEASTAAVQADTPTADTEAEVTEEAKGSSEKSEGSESEGGAAASEPAEATAKDDVEIPQQQTAEKAADNEAGESART
ncbi:hypothetical protein [Streptomyces mirabilis]|uniref:hypothetical protein n=1 Tax=Streptomyces mirabilis TaxID=68239 RepID=UPI0021C176C8|nr:hypothetical protein [Streptomyces mirabilis]